MGKLLVKLNISGVGQMLRSPEMQAVLAERAQGIQKKAGDGYKVYRAQTRAVAIVGTASERAAQENLANNTLLRSMK